MNHSFPIAFFLCLQFVSSQCCIVVSHQLLDVNMEVKVPFVSSFSCMAIVRKKDLSVT